MALGQFNTNRFTSMLLFSFGFGFDSAFIKSHALSGSLIRRNLSISKLAIYELPGTSDLSKFFILAVFK